MAISLVAHKAAASANGTSVTTSGTGVDTSTANLLIVAVCWYDPGGTPAITDSKVGNTWTPLSTYAAGASGLKVTIWYSIPTSVGAGHTFTATTTSGTIYPSIAMLAFSGAASSSVFDVESGNSTTPGTTVATGSITPGSAGEVVVSSFINNAGAASSIDSSFFISDIVSPGGNNYGLAMAYLIQTSAASVNPTWTNNSSAYLAAGIASFKAGGGAPPSGGLFLPVALNGLGSGGPFFGNPIGMN